MAGNVTRLDLQVTIDGVPAGTNLAGESLRRLRRNLSRRGRPVEWSYLLTRQRGATLYLGSRESAVYARLYDKSAEQGSEHLGGKWRYEIETKADVALRIARELVASNSARQLVVGTVHEHFLSRGIAPAFDGEGEAVSTTPQSHESDDERRLAWLRDQVSVVVARLGAAGRADDVARALDPLGHYLAVSERVAVGEWERGVRALKRLEARSS
jgi:DNA relaxase NicK